MQLQQRYESALRQAAATPANGPPDAAWHWFLTLNAAFYLGYWLALGEQRSLLEPLLAAPTGLLGLPLPADPTQCQVALQHVAEVAAMPGMGDWARNYTLPTPQGSREEHDTAVLAAALRLLAAPASSAALHDALTAHAARRLWQLGANVSTATAKLSTETVVQMRCIAQRAARENPHHIMLAEALLTEREELAAHPTADLLLDALDVTLSLKLP